jgi:drug/metabolite transporter (DMT)-like permease
MPPEVCDEPAVAFRSAGSDPSSAHTDRKPIAVTKAYIIGLICALFTALSTGPSFAFIRLLDDQVPVSQILFLRGVFLSICLMGFFVLTGRARKECLTPVHPRQLVYKSLLWYGGTIAFIAALMLVDFALLNAIIMVSPMMIIALARIFLGERITRIQQFGVAVAFSGVLFCILPDIKDPAQSASLVLGLALAGIRMLTIGVTSVMSRFLAQRETIEVYMLIPNVQVTVLALSGLLYEDWVWPNAQASWLLAGYFFVQLGMTFGGAIAAREVPAPVFSAIHYIQLPIAALVGWMLFAEVPDILFYPGAAIMVAGLVLASGIWRPDLKKARPLSPKIVP